MKALGKPEIPGEIEYLDRVISLMEQRRDELLVKFRSENQRSTLDKERKVKKAYNTLSRVSTFLLNLQNLRNSLEFWIITNNE